MYDESLSLMNNGDPTFMSFATDTQSALDLKIVTPDLYTEMEWYVHESVSGSDHYPTVFRMIEPNISKLGKIPK
jgi:hypothetical protein